jgi:phosphate-selective porin OprO/OprP
MAQLASRTVAILAAAGITPLAQAAPSTQELEERLTQVEEQLKQAEGDESPWDPYVSEFGGRIMYDQTFNIDGDDSLKAGLGVDDLEEGAELRRVRFYAEGSVAPWLAYKLQLDFAGDGPEAKDVYLKAHDLGPLPTVKVGHFKEPISLQEQTSSKYISLMSRTMLADNVISQGRSSGLMLSDHYADERLNVALGVFNPSFDGETGETTSQSTDGEIVVTGRVTSPLIYRDGGRQVVHVGAAFSQRNVGEYELGLEPEVHKTDDFVSTGGAIAVDDVQVYGAELAGVFGPAHFQGEYGQASLDTENGTDPSIDTYYVQGGFFLTGESRPYDKADGSFGRVHPNSPFTGLSSGPGAWELVARYSTLDAEETGSLPTIGGGTVDPNGVAETSVTTVGVNWYPVAHAKWMLNYTQAEQEAYGDASYIASRFQVDF